MDLAVLNGWQIVAVLLGVLFTFCFITYGWIVMCAWAMALESKWRKK